MPIRYEHTVLKQLGMSERKGLCRRLGYHNMYDEVTAVNYYELDLSNPQMRCVTLRIGRWCCGDVDDDDDDVVEMMMMAATVTMTYGRWVMGQITRLAILEPGENMVEETYVAAAESRPIFGFESI